MLIFYETDILLATFLKCTLFKENREEKNKLFSLFKIYFLKIHQLFTFTDKLGSTT